MTRGQIERELARQLPRGTSRQKVIAFLEAHHVENSSSSKGAPQDQIFAIYRDVRGGTPIVAKSVQVIFHFRKDVLESFTITEKYTGP